MSGLFMALALLALTGWAFSFYFHQVYRRKLPPDTWWIPAICRVGANTCETIVETPYGMTFGKPNALWGSLFYPLLFGVVVATGFLGLNRTLLLALSLAMVGVSLYLIWGLYRLKVLCRVCVAVHIINFSFFVLVLIDRLN